MPFLMAECAGNVTVLAPARRQLICGFLVTGMTIPGGHIIGIGDLGGDVGFVAQIAGLLTHVLCVRLVAFRAGFIGIFYFRRVTDVALAAAHRIVLPPLGLHRRE